MRSVDLNQLPGGFEVLARSARSEAAAMTLAPAESTGGPDNRHQGGDQWLLVLSGRGRAIVCGEEVALAPGLLLLIERGEAHEVRGEGDEPLRTVNMYSALEY